MPSEPNVMTEASAPPGQRGGRAGRRAAFWWISPLVLLCVLYLPRAVSAGIFNVLLGDLHRIGPLAYLLLSAALVVPLLWRYERPVVVFGVVAAVAFAQWLLIGRLVPADLAVLVAMYAVARRGSLRWSLAAGVLTEVGVLLATQWQRPSDISVQDGLDSGTLVNMFVVSSVWFAARYAKTRVHHRADVAERDQYAAIERDQRVQLGAAGERARIARELHDVVAHNVSVIVVHAEGGRQALDRHPQQTREALDTIWSTGKQVLAEMRSIIGVLRAEDDTGGTYTPQPGISELEELVAQVRTSGVSAELAVLGSPMPLSSGVQLAVYRIVQESLTNVIKHGGPDAHAEVLLAYQGDEVIVEIRDDGGHRAEAGTATEDGVASVGHGLLGMRERAALYGGTLEAAPQSPGGYRVRARMPVIAGL